MRRSIQRHRARLIGLIATVSLAAAGSMTATTPSAEAVPAAVTAAVSVDTGHVLANIPATGVGTNVAVYDGSMTTPARRGQSRANRPVNQ